MYMGGGFCPLVCLCIMYMPGACREEMRVDPLELVTVVSCLVDAENQTQALWKNSQGSNHWAVSLRSPVFGFWRRRPL